ncbi:MAG: DUF4142 domain-containing protein [Phycisphaeraceae bacterium]
MQTNEPLGVPRAETQSITAEEFVNVAASTDLFEIRTAELAMAKDVGPQTQELAEQLMEEHTASARQLMMLAEEEGISMPQQMLPHHQQMYDELARLDGQRFDEQYLDAQRMAHAEAIVLFEQAAVELENPEFRQFAEQTLPALREHEQMVQQQRRPVQPQ